MSAVPITETNKIKMKKFIEMQKKKPFVPFVVLKMKSEKLGSLLRLPNIRFENGQTLLEILIKIILLTINIQRSKQEGILQ